MISTDSHLRITFMNPVAEQMCGWPLDLAIGMPIAGVVRLTNGKDGPEIENLTQYPRQGRRITRWCCTAATDVISTCNSRSHR